jgi:hypothetical protein
VIVWWMGCAPALEQEPAAVLSSFGFGWEYFNHRLSHLEVAAGADAAQVAIVGGTSTTNQVVPDLPPACTSACEEFPFVDQSLVDLRVDVLASDRTALLPAEVTLEVGRDGAEGTLRASVPKGVKGNGAVLLAGLLLDGGLPLDGGPGCYDPSYGWHLSRLQLALGEATVRDDLVTAPLTAAVAAGNTHDPDRVCIDEVNDQMRATVRVRAVFLVGEGVEAADVSLADAREYPFSGNRSDPGDQEPAPDQVVDWGLADGPDTAGVAAMDWVFYPEVFGAGEAEQGAYLRTLAFGADAAGTARLAATNFSPGTQLEGFSYAVDAVARAVSFDGEVDRWSVDGVTLETQLEAGGAAVVHEIPRP